MATVELTSDGHVHEAAGTTRLDMTATWSVPEDADVSEAGIVYGLLDEGTERPDNEAFFDSCFSTDNKSVSASTAANGTYSFTERLTEASAGKNLCAVAYIRYTVNNEEKTVLSEMLICEPYSHSWDEGKVTKPATTSAEGVMTYTCTE